MTITKHTNALRFSINMEDNNGRVLGTVYHGDRRLCRIVLSDDCLMVTVDNSQSTGFQSCHLGVGWSTATWTLPEHYPNDLFDIDFTEDDK